MKKTIVYLFQGAPQQGAIHDYCIMFAEKMDAPEIEVRIAPFLNKGESVLRYIRDILAFVRSHKQEECVFHFHYPGWQWTLMFSCFPQFLLWKSLGGKARCLSTIHDFTKFTRFFYPVFFILFRLSEGLIFSTENEYKAAHRLMQWFGHDISAKSTIIPIGSNIEPAAQPIPDLERRGVVYFGHIRAGKGLDFFVQAAQLCHQNGNDMPFYIMGNVENWDVTRYRYILTLMNRIYHLTDNEQNMVVKCRNSSDFATLVQTLGESKKRLPNVSFVIGAPARDVSQRIAACRFALQPFPDGASMRRGSLQAVLVNRCITLTRWGDQTTDAIRSVTLCVETPDDAAQILSDTTRDYSTLLHNLDDYLRPVSWAVICDKHKDVYVALAAQ